MAARQAELFEKPKRPTPAKRAHVSDAGEGTVEHPFGARFTCARCEWESEWLCFETEAEIRRGVPCELCNT
jgi:hypothetical protein